MKCTLNRWGTGTCPPPKATQETKLMEDKLKKMKEEREKQDTMWTKPEEEINEKRSK